MVSTNAEMGNGIFVGKNAVINAGATVGDNSIINTGAIVEHDCSVGEFAHVELLGECLHVDVQTVSFVFAGARVVVQEFSVQV